VTTVSYPYSPRFDWEFSPAPPHLVTACRLMPLRVRLFAEMWTGGLAGSAPGSGAKALAAG